jgi:hypothetical protein
MKNFGTKGCMYCEGECNKECLPKPLEEAAEIYERLRMGYDENYYISNDIQDLKESYYYKGRRDECIIRQERMYSEEEVLNILYKHTEDLLAGKKVTLEEWFKQFKNK